MSLNCKEHLTENWCFTHYEIIKICCTWVIRDFDISSELIDEWKSPIFSSHVYDEYKFSLYIKRVPSYTQTCNLFLSYSDPSELLVSKIKFKFSILNGNQKESHVSECTVRIEKNKKSMVHVHDFKNFYDQLCENNLTICFDLIAPKVKNIPRMPVPGPKTELNKDFGILFQNGKFTDFLLVADGKEFHVHKAILAGRSEVFAAMFELEMQEKKLNRAEISDVDPEVFQEMLQFIYTGVVTKLHQMAKFLLVVADKYALESLKKMCEKKMIDQLSIRTATETLILADRHGAFELKAKTLKFINDNSTEVVKTEDWKDMEKSHAYLVVEAYQKLATEPTTEENKQVAK